MAYPFPNWLQPPDIASEFARGQQLGLEQSRIQMQQEENQRSHLMEQQRLEVDRAFKEQQLAMDKQQLDQATKLNQLKIQDAAQRMSAQKSYQDFVNAGGDPTEGMLKYGMQLGLDSSGFYNLAAKAQAAKHPFVPSEMTTAGGTRLVQLSPNRYEVAPDKKDKLDEPTKLDLQDAYKELEEQRKLFNTMPDKKKDNSGVLKALRRIHAIESSLGKESTAKRIKVVGPNGQKGTVPEGTDLPEGWKLAQ